MAVLYRHLKPCGEVFYIGIGKDLKRAYHKKDRNNHWHNVVNKYGREVQILKRDLTWEDACELEILLIAYYGRMDLGLGKLVNKTDGGEGNLNPSKETRKRIRDSKIDESRMIICTKTLKTWFFVTDCARDIGINPTTLAIYLCPNSRLKNTTTIMLYDDYIKNGVKEPYIPKTIDIEVVDTRTGKDMNIRVAADELGIKQGILHTILKTYNTTYFVLKENYSGEIHYPKQKGNHNEEVINTYTKEVFLNITEAAKRANMRMNTLAAKLSRTDPRPNNTFFVLLKDYDGSVYSPIGKDHSKEVINKKTKEIFKSIFSAARSVNMCGKALSAKLSKTNKRQNDTDFMLLSEYEALLKK